MKTARLLPCMFAFSACTFAMMMSACEKAEAPAKPAAKTNSTASGDGHAHKDGDGHAHQEGDGHDHADDGHDDHSHEDGHDHDHDDTGSGKTHDDHSDHDHGDHGHGDSGAIGTVTIGEWTVVVSGEIEAGSEAHLDIELSGSEVRPAAVRVWIGTQDGKGAMKQKADGDGKSYHAHTDVPNPIPADAQLWIEIDDGKGGKTVGGVQIKK